MGRELSRRVAESCTCALQVDPRACCMQCRRTYSSTHPTPAQRPPAQFRAMLHHPLQDCLLRAKCMGYLLTYLSHPHAYCSACAHRPLLCFVPMPTLQDCLLRAKRLGYQVVATHLSPDAVDISQIDWTRPTAFVMGNEEKGELLRASNRTYVE